MWWEIATWRMAEYLFKVTFTWNLHGLDKHKMCCTEALKPIYHSFMLRPNMKITSKDYKHPLPLLFLVLSCLDVYVQ